jgi:hypothetical protein
MMFESQNEPGASSSLNFLRPDYSDSKDKYGQAERVTRSGFLYRSKSFAGESKGAPAGLGGWSEKWYRRAEGSKLRSLGLVATVIFGWLVINRM